jgi:hypothetical protein
MDVQLDQKLEKTLGNGQFLFLEVEPNQIHEVAVKLAVPASHGHEGPPTLVQVNCLPGKSYYLLAWITSVKYDVELRVLPDEEGQKYVRQLDMVIESDRPSIL